MLNNQHFVEELFFDISFPTEDEAFSQQALLGEFVSDTLAGEVDAVFGDCSMVDSVLRIDRLEVDLGTVPYQNYQAELTERLGKRLRERLRDYQAIAHTKNGAGVTVVARGIAELETCQYFVRYGYLPWHCRTESELAVSQMFLRVIESQCSAVIKMLSSVQLPDVALARLADVVPLNGLITIARQLLHGEFNTVARLLNNLSEGQVLHGWFGRVSRKNANDCMRDLWRGVIGTLLYLGSNGGAGVIVGAVILKHCDRQGRTRLRKVRKFLCELKGYDARHQEVNTALYDVINVLDISIADNLGVDRELKAETPLSVQQDEIERMMPAMLAEWIENADPAGLKKIAAQWDIVLEKYSVLLKGLVRAHGRKTETRNVLVQLFSSSQLCDLIGLIDPPAQRFVLDTVIFFEENTLSTKSFNVTRFSMLGNFSDLNDEKNLWRFTFYFILVERGNRFNKRQYCRSLLREIAAHENFSYGELLDDLQQWLSSVTERNRYAGELLLIINELVDDQGQDNVSPCLPLATSPDDEIERVTPVVLAEWIKNADSSGLKKIAAQWDIILERHSVLLENLVRVHGRKAETRGVLAQLLSPGQLCDLIGLIDPLAQRFVQDTIIFFTGSVSSTNRSNIRDFSELSDEQNLWNFTFDFIFVERGNWFNKRLYCGNLLRGMAAHNNFSYHELLDDLQQWLSAVVKRNRYVDELLLIINELVEDQSRSDLLPHCSSVTTPTIEVSELVDEQMDNLRLTRGAAADTDTPGSIDNSIQSSFRDVLDSSAAVYLENAGQVLLAPYLPSLFERLGLLKGGQFNDHRASERAVHVLQYMVDGIGAAPEYMMVLNKLICGVSSARPITRDIIVSDTDKVFIDGLLVAAIENWKGIGNTSVDGLRQSFLQREGKLQLKDEQWQLLVAPRSYDMLLDKLPWSYSTIKYSWMPRVIHVEWR
ncbi:MAG: hypothetical protein L3K25_19635 [Gammaproteobacteria bacterium]|nr:hypothetical protein [Gammaproteobacteria bacterium]